MGMPLSTKANNTRLEPPVKAYNEAVHGTYMKVSSKLTEENPSKYVAGQHWSGKAK